MKIVFMGTPDFAATILKDIHDAGHEIAAVYTQPDRPKGRSGKPVASPVKEYALAHNMPVYQPERIKRPEEVSLLKTFDADVFVVAAYGQIISQEILDIPKYCCVNTHGSLLPKLRGASPIQRAIASGEKETGVTCMRMDAGVDTGDIISVVTVPIEDDDDESSMYEKLAIAGGKLLVET
ncbi:MAG: methionyl-tRNA formyltransferase, partial [Lachnospiraceae bacterium]|nr:methionyl-tRNA formyltransferase [Lachnospiraceae bacterium]